MERHSNYINTLKLGDLVAFRLYYKSAKMYSGKIVAIGATRVEVQTKNGKRFFIDKSDITWVNTTGKWPRFVMNAFKGIDSTENTTEIAREEIDHYNEAIEEETEIEKEEVTEEEYVETKEMETEW